MPPMTQQSDTSGSHLWIRLQSLAMVAAPRCYVANPNLRATILQRNNYHERYYIDISDRILRTKEQD